MARGEDGCHWRGLIYWAAYVALLHAASSVPVTGPGSLDITLLVRSQDTAVDRALLQELRQTVAEAGWPHGAVVSMVDAETKLRHRGLWTYKPWIYLFEKALEKERRRSAGGQRWIVFLEPATAVDPLVLVAQLSKFDAQTHVYLGRKLVDADACIIHHYQQEPPYPHVHAGFALSGALLRLLMKDLKKHPLQNEQQIEPVWELAKWIKGLQVDLTDRSNTFCAASRAGCATWVRPLPSLPVAEKPLKPIDVIIAVKTVSTFHSSRVPIVHDLWGKSSPTDLVYMSNMAYEEKKHSEALRAAVVNLSPEFGDAVDPNKESNNGSGHCSKMKAILEYLSKHEAGRQWYVVTDDDTLLDVRRLLEILSLHDSSKAIYLGERYGWAHQENREGSNYMTTGSGMAISAPALAELMSCKQCTCASMSAPDDMTLGSWFGQLDVQMVHDESFHQSEPHNYHADLLQHGPAAVSFHRFNVRLPEKTPAKTIDKARRKSWKEWQKTYFQKKPDKSEL